MTRPHPATTCAVTPVNGWIILDKPLHLGSTQAVAATKRNLRAAGYGKVKTGHGGTLDPLASGVLPIALGEATKLTGRMLDASKVYAFTITFGRETDTLDLEGAITAQSTHRPTADDIKRILPQFTGPVTQVPPAYSALKIDGKRAYDRARAGEDITPAPRDVTIHDLRLADCAPCAPEADPHLPTLAQPLASATFEAHVSKGTYIRSLARDIAIALGTCGHVTMLRRLKAGPFTLADAISLDKLNEIGQGRPLENVILPLEAGLVDIPALDLDPDQARAVRQGQVLTGLPHTCGLYWVRTGQTPLALVAFHQGCGRVVRGFNLPDVAE